MLLGFAAHGVVAVACKALLGMDSSRSCWDLPVLHHLKQKRWGFASPQATAFPSSLSLPSESFSYHQTLNPSCSCQSLFFPLSSPFFSSFAAPADTRQPPRPSPARQG